MSATSTYYTDIYPKQGEITGSTAQACGKGEQVISYVIGGIKAKTTAAIGTCAPGLSVVQYLYAPRIHHDLGGEPTLIVGNASNMLGEFSCVYIPFTALRQFVCMADEKKMDSLMFYLLHLENEILANTDWFDSPDKKYVCALLPNFFILYFDQKPPTGDITTDDVKMEFATLGKGYEAWRTAAEEAIHSAKKIAQVKENVASVLGYDEVDLIRKHCDVTWTGKKNEPDRRRPPPTHHDGRI
jgi:hypothetical protein